MKSKGRIVAAAVLSLSLGTGAVCVRGSEHGRSTSSTGTVGTNGLPPKTYWKYVNNHKLIERLNERLTKEDQEDTLADAFGDILQDASDENSPEATLVRHAIGCALESDKTVRYTDPRRKVTFTFKGESNIASTNVWLTRGLKESEQVDVHACLAARVNPNGPTSVWMNGERTKHDKDSTKYPALEAGWQAVVEDGGVKITVWPVSENRLEELNKREREAFNDHMHRRVCGQDAGACGFIPGTGYCHGDGMTQRLSYCDGANADAGVIETRISCDAYCAEFGKDPPMSSCLPCLKK